MEKKNIFLIVIAFLLGAILGAYITLQWGINVAVNILDIGIKPEVMRQILTQYGSKILAAGYI